MIDLRSLEVFYWVAKLGGFGRAAERLHTTQPAISARVASLEAQLGIKLLDREARRRPILTAKGSELLGYAERMLALSGEIDAAMADPSGLRATVRLGTSETLVHTWLSALVRRVHALYPRMILDVTVDVSPNLRAALLDGEIDVAFLLGPVAAPGVTDLPLCQYELGWAASPNLFPTPESLTLAELARVPVITYPRTTAPFRQIATLLSQCGHPTTRIFSCSALSSVVRMAVDGIGVCVVPPAVIRRELETGELRLLDVTSPLAPLTFTASHFFEPSASPVATVAALAVQIAAA